MIHIPRPSSISALIRSRLRPLDISYEIAQEVMGNYGLSIVGKPVNLALSRRTANIVVPTNEGRVVLKRYRDHLQNDGIQYIHSIIMYLIKSAFPVPRLLSAPSGEDFVSLNAGRFAVSEFSTGFNHSLDFLLPSDRHKLLVTSGKILASFHKTLKGFQPAGEHHLGFVSYTDGWQRDVDWFASKLHELKEKSTAITDDVEKKNADFLVAHSDETFDEFYRLDEKLLKANLMRTIIHGDFGLHNLIFKSDGSGVLTDFETSRLEWKLADLVFTLSRQRHADNMYNLKSIKHFMAGYQFVFPIKDDEWQCLSDVWQFIKLRSVFIGWNSYFEREGKKLVSAVDAYKQAVWAKENALTLSRLGSS